MCSLQYIFYIIISNSENWRIDLDTYFNSRAAGMVSAASGNSISSQFGSTSTSMYTTSVSKKLKLKKFGCLRNDTTLL
jgi:hypothetical protein